MDGSGNHLCPRCTYLVQAFYNGLTSIRKLAYRFVVAPNFSALEDSVANSCQLCTIFLVSILEDFGSTSLATHRANGEAIFLAETMRLSSRYHHIYIQIGCSERFRAMVTVFTLDQPVEKLAKQREESEVLRNSAMLGAWLVAIGYRKDPIPENTSGKHCVEDDESSDSSHEEDSDPSNTSVPMIHNICTAQGLEDVAAKARRWLAKCTTEHTKCSAQQDRIDGLPLLPTRVLDVGTDNNPSLRLFVAPSGRRGEYAALSYCWGDGVQVKMTKTTLDDMQQEILLSTLPQTIQDSIIFTRKLGVGYLWVDALCVMQAESSHDEDHIRDWQREAARFGGYYQNALCTLAATASRSASGGLFYPFHGKFPKYLSIRQGPDVHVWIPSGRVDSSFLTDAPLYQRGWAIQERILSPRMISFSERFRIWECGELWASEEYPDSDLKAHYYKYSDPAARVRDALMEGDVESLQSIWLKFCEQYAEKKFTKPSDRLPALSGVARRVQALTGAKYYAGIWEGQILDSLCWYNERWGPVTRPENPVNGTGPSWSWAIMTQGSVDNLGARRYAASAARGSWATDKNLRVLDVEVDHLGRDTDGLVTGGTLTVEGDLSTLDMRRWQYQRRKKSSHIWVHGAVPHSCYLFWDWDGTDDEVLRTHFCLKIRIFEEGQIGAMILDPITTRQKGPRKYKRVGFGYIPNAIWERGEPKRGIVRVI